MFIVSMVVDVYDESEVPDIVEEVERRNEERMLRKRERLPKRGEEGILNWFECLCLYIGEYS